MTGTLGLTHAIISPSTEHDDPFVYHIHGLRENGDKVLVASIHDELPMFATRILRVLKDLGIEIEGDALAIDFEEPDILFIETRESMDENEIPFTDLETRFVDGQKLAAATFAVEFDAFATAMAELHPRPATVVGPFALFSHYQHEASGGWGDLSDVYDTLADAQASSGWTTPAAHSPSEIHIVDLTAREIVAEKTITPING